MATKKSVIEDIDDDLLEDDDQDFDTDIGQEGGQLLSRRRIEELREEKELRYSIWGDFELE